MVDAVVLVIRHGGTRREVVRRAKETVERAGGKILGVVLNKRKFPIPEFLYRRL
jgi:Mrp family chromosome partitioning ATPase